MKFVGDFASWQSAGHRQYVDVGRALVAAAYGADLPLVVDPFAGGGAIPLEALRLGCGAFASDLNPVACLILRVMLEDVPRHGPDLASELRGEVATIITQVKEELSDLFPADLDGAIPVAYLWARTVRCEAPNCGTEIPLTRSFWLSRKGKRRVALRPVVEGMDVKFSVFEPTSDGAVAGGTVSGARATCLRCGSTLPPERVRSQLAVQRGGADVVFGSRGSRTGGARLMAVVTRTNGTAGRKYRVSSDRDYAAVRKSQEAVASLLRAWEREGKEGLCPVPDESLPPVGTLGFRVQRYGMLDWGDLFTARQKVAFATAARLIGERYRSEDGEAIASLLSFALDKAIDFNCSLARWRPSNEDIGDLFGRQAIPFTWDFAESDITQSTYVGLERSIGHITEVLGKLISVGLEAGATQQADAAAHPLPDESSDIWFTDPPYYDAVPYADLSDFFFVWLKRALPNHPLLRDPFDSGNPLTPKCLEAVQDLSKTLDGRPKNREWFEQRMAGSFSEGRRTLREDGIGSVVFAHKTTDGWEALLAGLIQGGWTITGSWPIATEMATRLRARDSAALATSVHLICRPRSATADVGDWADVLRELPERVGEWMQRLQTEGVRGADLVFACIGPALEIYSRFRAVETAEGERVGLREYLEKVWEVVGRGALRQVLEADGSDDLNAALEEDARLTALFLWTMQSTEARSEASGSAEGEGVRRSGFTLPYDVVRRFAQPMGIDLDAATGRIIDQKKGVVHLLSLAERAKVLFGSDGAPTPVEWNATGVDSGQMTLFDDFKAGPSPGTGGESETATDLSLNRATTLDRIHSGMVLQAGGNAGALRSLIDEEGQRGPGFLRLANALSALYPGGSQEKRVLDAMLLAVPR